MTRAGWLSSCHAGSAALRSWWNIGFFRGYDQEGLVCGYVDNQTALGQVSASREDEPAQSG